MSQERKQKLPKSKQNARRKERKYKRRHPEPQPGRCGSAYCTSFTGCEPWTTRGVKM